MWCHYEYIMNIYLAAKFNIAHNWYEQFYLFSSWNLVVFCCYMHLWLTVGIIMLFECVSHIIGHTYGSCFNSGRFFSFRWAMIRVHRPVSSWWLQMPCCQICAGTSTTALPTTAMQPESCHNHLNKLWPKELGRSSTRQFLCCWRVRILTWINSMPPHNTFYGHPLLTSINFNPSMHQ